jgi:hypothetical protein
MIAAIWLDEVNVLLVDWDGMIVDSVGMNFTNLANACLWWQEPEPDKQRIFTNG